MSAAPRRPSFGDALKAYAVPKPNPLQSKEAQAVVALGGEPQWRAAVAIDRSIPPEPDTGPAATAPVKPRMKRVDTAALTGLRGLAAVHVACGHIFIGSTLGQDLIGGAAMPFFFLLSGFVMTLGYGQTQYERPGCCGGGPEYSTSDGQGKAATMMDKSKFWQNRFARLFPVYAVTNLMIAGAIASMGGVGVLGTPQGLLGMGLQFSLAIFGLNTWFLPFVDVGMPPNGVTWTICTMSFFYWVFPYILPTMQRMSGERRRIWIDRLFLLQMFTYFATFWLWALAVPVLSLEPNELSDPFGEWRAGLDFEVSPSMGYWVARSWPPFRLLVFCMGCLAALNRLDVAKRQAALDAEEKQADRSVRDADCDGVDDDGRSLGLEKNPCNLGGLCSCCGHVGDSYPTLILPPPPSNDSLMIRSQAKEAFETIWAIRVDRCVGVYVGALTLIILTERFLQSIQGRVWLEAIVPYLELAIIVGLTYDGRRSYTSRFCNTRAITWLGESDLDTGLALCGIVVCR